MKRLAISCVAIFFSTNLANAQQAAPISAGEIIRRVSEVYASCTSYVDEGKEETKTTNHGGRLADRSFTTAFVRPSNFRFEESASRQGSEKRRFIAWSSGALASVWPAGKYSTNGRTSADSVYMNAISRRPQSIVLGLLQMFPGRVRSDTLLDLTEVKVTEERINDRPTFRLDGYFPETNRGEKGPMTSMEVRDGSMHITIGRVQAAVSVWVDQKDFLIIKIREKPNATETITTIFKPGINTEVSAGQLAFNPPSAPTPDAGPSTVEIVNFHFFEKAKKVGIAALLTYVYELTIRNHSPKKVEAVAWEQEFPDQSGKRLRRQTHFSKQSVEPNETEILREEVLAGRSRIVNAESTNPENDSNRVQISCVIYSDGSWWKDPTAKQFECEYLRRVILSGK